MHLVSAHGLPSRELDAGDFAQGLLLGEHRLDIEEAETARLTSSALDAAGVDDTSSEYLIAGTDAEHAAAASDMSEQVDVPTLRAQSGKISERRFRAREHDEIGVGRQRPPRFDDVQRDVGLSRQRIEIVEIGDARQ